MRTKRKTAPLTYDIPRRMSAAPTDKHKEALAQALDILEVTTLGIDAIESALGEARELAVEAKRTGSAEKRTLYAARIAALQKQIDRLAESTREAEINLIGPGQDMLRVDLDPDGNDCLVIAHFDLTCGPTGLRLTPVRGNFAATAEIERTLAEINTAAGRLNTVADIFRQSAGRIADALGKKESAQAASAAVPVKKKPGLRRRPIAS